MMNKQDLRRIETARVGTTAMAAADGQRAAGDESLVRLTSSLAQPMSDDELSTGTDGEDGEINRTSMPASRGTANMTDPATATAVGGACDRPAMLSLLISAEQIGSVFRPIRRGLVVPMKALCSRCRPQGLMPWTVILTARTSMMTTLPSTANIDLVRPRACGISPVITHTHQQSS